MQTAEYALLADGGFAVTGVRRTASSVLAESSSIPSRRLNNF
jgi:hypothetical protein